MQNLIWSISIRHNEKVLGKSKHFVTNGEELSLKIGNTSSQEIFVRQAIPNHAMMELKGNEFILTAQKKLIYKIAGKRKILTKGDRTNISLTNLDREKFPEERVVCSIIIKDTVIKNSISKDSNTLSSKTLAWLREKYGPVKKLEEGECTLIYKSINSPLIFKLLKKDLPSLKIKEFMEASYISQKLKHPQLIPLLEIIEEESLPLYGVIMDYFVGKTLSQWGDEHTNSDQVVFKLLKDVVGCCEYLHKQNYIHGNITPDNILIDTNHECRITSFSGGFSAPLERTNYNAPELFSATAINEKVDIFSLGTLLYFLSTNAPPPLEISHTPPSFPKNFHEFRYKKLIASCTRHDPNQRLADTKEFWERFQEVALASEYDTSDVKIAHPNDTSDISIASFQAEITETDKEISKDTARTFASEESNQLSKYKIEEEKGSGVLGVVYYAINKETDQKVLLKILSASWLTHQEKEKILAEVQSTVILEHLNIVKIHEVGIDKGMYYIAMQYIEGHNLTRYVAEKELSPRESLTLVRDIARILQYAHAKGIIHRNIKPSNIIVNDQGIPYLMDFGLFRQYTLNTKNTNDHIYVAPELFKNASLSPLQDVYSLGVVLDKLLNKSLITSNQRQNISLEAQTICRQALRKNPKNRYQNAAALADDIERFLNCKPILARRFDLGQWQQWISHYSTTTLITIIALIVFLFVLLGHIFYISFVYPSIAKRQTIEQLKQDAYFLYRKYRDEYLFALAELPLHPESQGLSPKSLEAEVEILQKLRNQIQQNYKSHLQTRVLPLYRRYYQLEATVDHRKKLLDILQEIVTLSDNKREKKAFYQESLSVKGEDNISQLYTKLTLQIHPPQAQIHIFQYQETPEGYRNLLPFDVENKEYFDLPKDFSKKWLMQRNLLRSQNLLAKALTSFLQKTPFAAQKALEQSIENNPDHIDSYFLLCCVLALSTDKKVHSDKCILWQQKARKRIKDSTLELKDKEYLWEKFTPSFIQRISDLYTLLHQKTSTSSIERFIKITSIPQTPSPLHPEDIFYKIDSKAITSKKDLANAIKNKEMIECQLIRNYNLQRFVLNANFYQDHHFQIVEDIPIFFIWDNQPLEAPTEALFTSPKNRISAGEILLPPGEYLLTQEHKKYFSVRYPFKIDEFSEKSLELKLPKKNSVLKEHLKDFAVVAKGFSREVTHKNSKGFLMGRFEITISQWMAYLQAIKGNKNWNHTYLKAQFPVTEFGHALFHVVDGKLTLRMGKPKWAVFGVDFLQIQRYIKWRNQQLPQKIKDMGLKFRLPTIGEWQRAASGYPGRFYPWGNYPNPKFCKVLSAREYRTHQEPIAKYNFAFCNDFSPFGLYEMGGGVSEYITLSGGAKEYAVVGGNWGDYKPVLISTIRYCPDTILPIYCGFRLAAGLDPLYLQK